MPELARPKPRRTTIKGLDTKKDITSPVMPSAELTPNSNVIGVDVHGNRFAKVVPMFAGSM